MDSKIELLNKLKRLMQSDNEYERKSAEEKLNMLIKKYNIDESELNDNSISRYTFYYHNDMEKQLIRQIISMILGLDASIYVNRGKGKKIRFFVDCTYKQYIEISIRYDFYKQLLEEELDIFVRAFVYKHRLYANTDNDSEDKLTNDEISKIIRAQQMMKGMQDKDYINRIEGN